MRPALIAALSLAAAATAGGAAAQSWTSYGGAGARPYGYDTGRHYSNPYRHDGRSSYGYRSYGGQADRPGDYRCDAFWDANRSDCAEAWRDQRHRSSYGQSYSYRQGYGGGYGYRSGGYGYGSGGATYPGAYGRPDVVYPGVRGGYVGGAVRDAGRTDWCRRTYRSYDPASGYYRAYSGRLIWCG